MTKAKTSNVDGDPDQLMKELEQAKASAPSELPDALTVDERVKALEAERKAFEVERKAFADERAKFAADAVVLGVDTSIAAKMPSRKIRALALRDGQRVGTVHTDKGVCVRAVNVKEGEIFDLLLDEGARVPKWVKVLD